MFANGLSSGAARHAGLSRPLVTMARQRPGAAPAADRAVRHRAAWPRLRLLDGRMPGLPLGGAVRRLVERAIVVCGSARTSVHNKVFLSGLLRTLEAAPAAPGQRPVLRRAARRDPRLRPHLRRLGAQPGLLPEPVCIATALGAPDLETFLKTDWEDVRRAARPPTSTPRRSTWEDADISANGCTAATWPRRSRAITARVLLMPSATDLYFRVADNEAELPYLQHGVLRPIPSIWGHAAGQPGGHPGRAGIPDQPGPVLAGPLTRVAAWQRGHLPWQEPSWRPRRRIKICSVASQPCPLRSAG